MTSARKRFNASQLPKDVGTTVERLASDLFDRAAPSPADAQTFRSRIGLLVEWCHRQGLELTAEVVLHPDTIDRFVATGCSHLTPGSRSNYRSVLSRIGEFLLGPEVYPPRRLPLTSSTPVDCYSEHEERSLRSWVRGLPTLAMREDALVVLSLGLGAGLTSSEITSLRGGGVLVSRQQVVLVIAGTRARRVPVLEHWEADVSTAAERARRGLVFRPERTRAVVSHVSRFVERLPRGDAPKLSTQRLRASWLVRHLEAGVPINMLAIAAGIAPERLVRYVRSMRPVSSAAADRILRGTST
jgi:hypothetical protein